jgi:hypothetical protein
MSHHAETATGLCKATRRISQQRSCWQSRTKLNREQPARRIAGPLLDATFEQASRARTSDERRTAV